ncbi:MAG: GNAT family N-acetyltransferase [Deltaproteobacteria bacterium]|nr:GNAT family N-acetyltransferase [Deltaproteobacteria bacterium]
MRATGIPRTGLDNPRNHALRSTGVVALENARMREFSGTVRPAEASDHAAFAALFPELGVPDPVPDQARFVREIVPTALFALQGSETVGYGHFRVLGETAHVVHLITTPSARRTGVGSAVMKEIARRAAARGCTSWYLNTFPSNHAAIALYTALGFAQTSRSQALKMPWAVVERTNGALAANDALVVRRFDASEDTGIESACGLIRGQLASLRALDGRILMVLLRGSAVGGFACFDPTFPGIYPFRVTTPDLGWPLLASLRPHARPTDELAIVVVENQPSVADELLAAGGMPHLTTVRMSAPLAATAAT